MCLASVSSMCRTSCPSSICWEDCPFSTELFLPLCQRSVNSICQGVFLYFLPCFTDIYVYSLTNTALSWFLLLNTVSQGQVGSVLWLCAFHSACIGYSGSFAFPYKLETQVVDIHKWLTGILIGIVRKWIINSGRTDIRTI